MVSYTMTPKEEDYEFIAKIYMRESKSFKIRKRKLATVCVLSLIIMAMSIAGMLGSNHYDNGWLAFLAVGTGCLLTGSYQLLFGAHRQTLRAMKQAEQDTGEYVERTYTFGDDITVHSEKADSRFSWDIIDKWGEEDGYLYLRHGNSFILVDENEIKPEEMAELKGYIKKQFS